jgi:hypothetical protein
MNMVMKAFAREGSMILRLHLGKPVFALEE